MTEKLLRWVWGGASFGHDEVTDDLTQGFFARSRSWGGSSCGCSGCIRATTTSKFNFDFVTGHPTFAAIQGPGILGVSMDTQLFFVAGHCFIYIVVVVVGVHFEEVFAHTTDLVPAQGDFIAVVVTVVAEITGRGGLDD